MKKFDSAIKKRTFGIYYKTKQVTKSKVGLTFLKKLCTTKEGRRQEYLFMKRFVGPIKVQRK